jgi:hypothetical protein
MEISSTAGSWKAGQKILFRFFAAYFAFYFLSFAVDIAISISGASVIAAFERFYTWIAKHLFQLTRAVQVDDNGSGDTTFGYIQQFLVTVFAMTTCITWTIIDRNKTNYDWLLDRVKIGVRYYLAFFLLVYGSAKFFQGQFGPPDLQRLSQPYGESSPMGLAWTFFGYSKSYNYFMGFFESIGGLLLISRRTTLLGTCIAATVMANVVMVNFCFDVPVKLFSSNLLLMILFIMATSSNRLINFFFLNKIVAPENENTLFSKRKWRIARVAGKLLFLVGITGMFTAEGISAANEHSTKKPELYGIYNIRSYEHPGNLTTAIPDSIRWSKFIIEDGYTVVEMQNKKHYYTSFQLDTMKKWMKVSFNKRDYTLHYQAEDSTIVVAGKWGQDSVCVKMTRYDESKYLLTNRGFHWINEYPFNR